MKRSLIMFTSFVFIVLTMFACYNTSSVTYARNRVNTIEYQYSKLILNVFSYKRDFYENRFIRMRLNDAQTGTVQLTGFKICWSHGIISYQKFYIYRMTSANSLALVGETTNFYSEGANSELHYDDITFPSPITIDSSTCWNKQFIIAFAFDDNDLRIAYNIDNTKKTASLCQSISGVVTNNTPQYFHLLCAPKYNNVESDIFGGYIYENYSCSLNANQHGVYGDYIVPIKSYRQFYASVNDTWNAFSLAQPIDFYHTFTLSNGSVKTYNTDSLIGSYSETYFLGYSYFMFTWTDSLFSYNATLIDSINITTTLYINPETKYLYTEYYFAQYIEQEYDEFILIDNTPDAYAYLPSLFTCVIGIVVSIFMSRKCEMSNISSIRFFIIMMSITLIYDDTMFYLLSFVSAVFSIIVWRKNR